MSDSSPTNPAFFAEKAKFIASLMHNLVRQGKKNGDNYRGLAGVFRHLRWCCSDEGRVDVDRYVEELKGDK